MAEQRFLGQIKADMDVCDVNGDRIGSVVEVYRHEFAPVSAREAGPERREDVIEVKTGFLGLGKRLYVPIRAVMDVTLGCVFVNQPRDQAEALGWDRKPAHLP